MKPTSLDFSRRTELAVEAQAIAAVSAVALPMEVPLLIVGAFARDLHVRYRFGKDPQRVTEDVDLAVAVPSWPAFHTLRQGLMASGEFSGQPAVLHSLRHASGLAVDLVPFSGVESAERRIAWPPRGEFVMDVFGFQEAQARAHSIQLPGNVPAKLSSLPALAILKLVTWRDRHFSASRKDAHDLMLIIGEYLALGNEDRLWSEFANVPLEPVRRPASRQSHGCQTHRLRAARCRRVAPSALPWCSNAQASSASSAVRRPVQSLLPFASPPPKCTRYILDSADDESFC